MCAHAVQNIRFITRTHPAYTPYTPQNTSRTYTHHADKHINISHAHRSHTHITHTRSITLGVQIKPYDDAISYVRALSDNEELLNGNKIWCDGKTVNYAFYGSVREAIRLDKESPITIMKSTKNEVSYISHPSQEAYPVPPLTCPHLLLLHLLTSYPSLSSADLAGMRVTLEISLSQNNNYRPPSFSSEPIPSSYISPKSHISSVSPSPQAIPSLTSYLHTLTLTTTPNSLP